MTRTISKPIAALLCLAAGLAVPAAPALAQNADPDTDQGAGLATGPGGVCLTDPAYAAFDFWVGTWAVFDPDGNKAGENSITKSEADCLITERWTGETGGTGTSINYLDPFTDMWRQIWVSPGVVIDYAGGLTGTGSMLLEGEIAYLDEGRTAPFRGEWTPLDGGAVRQHFQEYDAASGEWAEWFTGIYRPIPPSD